MDKIAKLLMALNFTTGQNVKVWIVKNSQPMDIYGSYVRTYVYTCVYVCQVRINL